MNINEQVELLMQGTEYGDETLAEAMAAELKERLIEAEREGRPLKVYCGFDPRTSDLHLGHTVPMRKLRQFQELGHEVTFVVGSYTSLIGDPSDKDILRPQLTASEVEENARTYAQQAYRILDEKRTRIRFNAEWLSELSFKELIELASNFTLQQFLTRENFKKRWESGDPVYLHETFYALMQGYDAYMLKADVQVGGTDQLFNIITAARKIMTFLGARPNVGIILGILPGTDGVVKMSKSLGNHIPLQTTPEDMYGKVMSIPDIAMPKFFRMVTRWTPRQIEEIEEQISHDSLHPRDAKMMLAKEIVSAFFSEEDGETAEQAFIHQFQMGELPEEMQEYILKQDKTVLDVMDETGLIKSRSEGRRLLTQNAVRFDDVILTDPRLLIDHEGVLQVGKRQFVRVKKA